MKKVRNGHRARAFTRWWLVLFEEVVIVHTCLGEEWLGVEDSVRRCEGIDQWNKVVLLSRHTGAMAVHELTGELLITGGPMEWLNDIGRG